MLGLLWATIIGTGLIGHSIYKNVEDTSSRNKAKKDYDEGNNEWGTYYDYNGNTRDLATGKRVCHTSDSYGRNCVVDENGKIIRYIHYDIEKALDKERDIKWEHERINAINNHRRFAYYGRAYECCKDLIEKEHEHIIPKGEEVYKRINKNDEKRYILLSSLKFYKIISSDLKQISFECVYEKGKYNGDSQYFIRDYMMCLENGHIEMGINNYEPDEIDKEFIDFFNREQDLGGWKKRSCERIGKAYCGEYLDGFYCANVG